MKTLFTKWAYAIILQTPNDESYTTNTSTSKKYPLQSTAYRKWTPFKQLNILSNYQKYVILLDSCWNKKQMKEIERIEMSQLVYILKLELWHSEIMLTSITKAPSKFVHDILLLDAPYTNKNMWWGRLGNWWRKCLYYHEILVSHVLSFVWLQWGETVELV